jgi:hypothetical protein
MKAINESIADWRKALGITVIFFVVAALFAIALNLMILISTIVDWLGIVLFIGVLLVALILIIKSVFILPALTEEETTKKAIVLGLEFTNRIGIIKFGVLLIFLAIAAIIAITGTVLITQVGIILGDMFYTPAIILAESFATTFFVCAITNYFYSNEKN